MIKKLSMRRIGRSIGTTLPKDMLDRLPSRPVTKFSRYGGGPGIRDGGLIESAEEEKTGDSPD